MLLGKAYVCVTKMFCMLQFCTPALKGFFVRKPQRLIVINIYGAELKNTIHHNP